MIDDNGGDMGGQGVYSSLSSYSLRLIDERQHRQRCRRYVVARFHSLEFFVNMASYTDLRCRSLCLSMSYLCCTILRDIHNALIKSSEQSLSSTRRPKESIDEAEQQIRKLPGQLLSANFEQKGRWFNLWTFRPSRHCDFIFPPLTILGNIHQVSM